MLKNCTTTPPELVTALSDYLNCPCEYFAPMQNDAPLMEAWRKAGERGREEGFVPVIVTAEETLLECLIMNTREDFSSDYDAQRVEDYRRETLSLPVEDGKAMFDRMTKSIKEYARKNDTGWEKDFSEGLAESEPEEAIHFMGLQSYGSRQTTPLLLAEIPVRNPWEIFAYLPFGGWNECPDTPQLMAAAKYWFEKHGAVPAVITHDVLEFALPSAVPQEQAMELAMEQYAFCTDIVDQAAEGFSVGGLAAALHLSKTWYFWWD